MGGVPVASYKFLVLTNATPGMEDEFERWYRERHLPDVLDVPGFVSAQRFRLADAGSGELSGFEFLAIYDVESDDPQAALEQLRARAGTDRMVLSPAMDPKASMTLYEAITPLVSEKDRR
jgi:hypothetical protein